MCQQPSSVAPCETVAGPHNVLVSLDELADVVGVTECSFHSVQWFSKVSVMSGKLLVPARADPCVNVGRLHNGLRHN